MNGWYGYIFFSLGLIHVETMGVGFGHWSGVVYMVYVGETDLDVIWVAEHGPSESGPQESGLCL
jgi:hypothetical protein